MSFTEHQMKLLDRLMEQQDQWRLLNELILEAVHDFADRYARETEGDNDD